MFHDRLPWRSGARARTDSGIVLIIVAGLTTILLGVVLAFVSRTRSDSVETRDMLAEVQSRLMMHAALMYLQETSRIGWGDATGECFGWTDARDGGLGPRGPRPAGVGGDGRGVPAPTWWTTHTDWPPFKWDADDADLPPVTARRGGWPLPGTATRAPMAVCVVPPYATQLTTSYNPVRPPVAYGSAGWDAKWNNAPATDIANYLAWPNPWIDRIFGEPGAMGMLDPQPVKDSWSAFRNGEVDAAAHGGDWIHERFDGAGNPIAGATQQLAVVPGSENSSWFRIYRETQADHDCLDNVGRPGTEWWDRVALADPSPAVPGTPKLRNWSVFIIACGAGGTRGYRFWDDAAIGDWESAHQLPPGTGRALEPVTAQESGLFSDRAAFEGLLSTSHIMWFRCEWSALESGARTMGIYNDLLWRERSRPWMGAGTILQDGSVSGSPPQAYQYTAQYATTDARATGNLEDTDTRSNSPKVYAGNIKWLQRLDRDPVLW